MKKDEEKAEENDGMAEEDDDLGRWRRKKGKMVWRRWEMTGEGKREGTEQGVDRGGKGEP